MLMPKEDLRCLREKYAGLLENDANPPDRAVSSTEKDNRSMQDNTANQKHLFFMEILFI